MNVNKWLLKNTADLTGKTVAISGATGGIGKELCNHLATLGANILTMDRNSTRSLALCEKIKARFPSVNASHVHLDLSDIDSVNECISYLKENVPDYIILNAGIYHVPLTKCNTGYNNVFSINFVSPYLICRAMQDDIKKIGGKIVAVGSIAHAYSKVCHTDIDFSERKKSSLVYGNSKRYLMYGIFETCDTECVSVAHPGITLTNITAHYPKLIFALIKYPMKVIFPSACKASLSIIKAMFEDTAPYEWVGPRLFNVWGMPKLKKLKRPDEEEPKTIACVCGDIAAKIKYKN